MKVMGREVVMAVLVIGGMYFSNAKGSPEPNPDAADSLRLQPDKTDLHRRENMSFVVTCSGQEPQWLGSKGKPLQNNNKIAVYGNTTYQLLMFTNVSVRENGNYTCKSNKDNSKKSFTLTVVETVIFGGASEQTARQSDNATLMCSPKGSPKPEIAWLRNGILVSNETSKFVIYGGRLLVRNVTRGDAGPYMCRAVQYGPDESFTFEHVINLTVQHGPEWHGDYAKDGDLVYGYLGGLANLTCVAEAQPVGNITWLRHKNEVKQSQTVSIFGDGRNSTLQLNLTDSSLFGDYTCRATNPLATRARVLTLKWGERAKAPSKPQPMTAPDARHAKLRVNRPEPPAAAPATPEPGTQAPVALDLIGLRLLVRPVHDHIPTDPAGPRIVDLPYKEDNEYTLLDLQPNTWYEVRAQWRNAAGLSEESEPGEIHTSAIRSAATVPRSALPLLLLPLLAVTSNIILSSITASVLTTDAILSTGAILSS